MQKLVEVVEAIGGLLAALSVVAGVLANVLPEGRAKTAASYAGLRLGKALQVLRGTLPEAKK